MEPSRTPGAPPANLTCRCLVWPRDLEKGLLDKGDHGCSVRLWGDLGGRRSGKLLEGWDMGGGLVFVQCPAWSHAQGRPVNTSG